MFYRWFLLVTALELLVEVAISIRNSRKLIRSGAVEIGSRVLPLMAVIYAGIYLGSLYESNLIQAPVSELWLISFLALFVAAKVLKFWAIRSLGKYWTMRVLIIPDAQVVTSGPYRWIRHPNYVAVLMEIIAIPLIAKCWITFLIAFSIFSVLLYFRIRSEEAALLKYTNYSARMASKKRFVPFSAPPR